jgi:hypothetical protein
MPTPWKWYKWALISLLLATSLRFSVARVQDSSGDPSPKRQPHGLELEEVLKQLEENLNECRYSVPDLSCKEHVVSSMEGRTDVIPLIKWNISSHLTKFQDSSAVPRSTRSSASDAVKPVT